MDDERHYLETTIHIREGFIKTGKIVDTVSFIQENDRSLTEVLTEVLTENRAKKMERLIKYIERYGQITPKQAEKVTGKSASTAYRYLATLVDAGVLVKSGHTNNMVYKYRRTS
ncbi:MAG: helix-turn-helix domain-containing protein [Clostridiales bacterium]|nr:helix-turn-helix domain-containing protein [Clostridiales bacterium]